MGSMWLTWSPFAFIISMIVSWITLVVIVSWITLVKDIEDSVDLDWVSESSNNLSIMVYLMSMCFTLLFHKSMRHVSNMSGSCVQYVRLWRIEPDIIMSFVCQFLSHLSHIPHLINWGVSHLMTFCSFLGGFTYLMIIYKTIWYV